MLSEENLSPEIKVQKPSICCKIKNVWFKFVAKLKKVFTSSKDVHAFRKKLVFGIVFGILFIIIILILIFGIGLYKYNWKNRPASIAQDIIPYPAGFVGTNMIYLSDYSKRVDSLEHYYNQLKQKPEVGYHKAILEGMINHKILEREARKNGIFVTDKEVEDAYQQLIAGEGGEEQVQKILKELWGYDIPYFKSLIKEKLLEEKVKQDIPISLHLKHFLLKVDAGADLNVQGDILRRIQAYYAEVKNGKNFTEEIKQFSEDATTKDTGGDLGTLYLDQIKTMLGQDCYDQIIALKTGEYAICRSQYGFNLVLLDEKKGKINKVFDAWFSDIKNKTKIWRFVGQK